MEKQDSASANHTDYVLKHELTVEALPASVTAAGGIIVDVEGVSDSSLRLAKDGHTVLLPQPTDDPNDPLVRILPKWLCVFQILC